MHSSWTGGVLACWFVCGGAYMGRDSELGMTHSQCVSEPQRGGGRVRCGRWRGAGGQTCRDFGTAGQKSGEQRPDCVAQVLDAAQKGKRRYGMLGTVILGGGVGGIQGHKGGLD